MIVTFVDLCGYSDFVVLSQKLSRIKILLEQKLLTELVFKLLNFKIKSCVFY